MSEQTEADRKQTEEKGATLVEYALLVALIAAVALLAVRYLGNNVSKQFSDVSTIIKD